MQTFDAIVVGIGAMGSAALQALAERGCRVLGLEQFGIAHAQGSSHGQTRIIRKAYFEHPDYVPLVTRAMELWRALECKCERVLFEKVGLLLVGPADGAIIRGTHSARAAHDFRIDDVSPDDFRKRFPQFVLPAGCEAVFEVDAGFLHVEECVAAQCQAALDAGAQLETGAAVLHWERRDGHFSVHTAGECYLAERLIFCAGPWTSALLREAGLPLTVKRKPQLWFRCGRAAYAASAGSPVFGYDWHGGFYYGFPALEPGVIKVSEHYSGDIVRDVAMLDRELHSDDGAQVCEFVRTVLPLAQPEIVRHAVCMYTMTPDEHFILDHLPSEPKVWLAAGFSGHGFKFAPLIGQILADYAESGRTDAACEFLRLARLQAPANMLRA